MVSAEFNLRGKAALIAGDERFWGKFIAAALAEAGASVAIAARDEGKLAEAISAVRRLKRKAVAIPADVTKARQVRKVVEQAISELGRIDILVTAADLQLARPFLETKKADWQQVIDANLTSVFHCCQAVGRHMLAQKRGRIINITSCLAERGVTNGAAYCVAMGGVLQLTRVLALEWARHGITVNAIAAGWFSETQKTGTAQEDGLLRFLPMKRYGHPGEIGSLVVYLASDASEFMTGQLLHVDGGVMVHA